MHKRIPAWKLKLCVEALNARPIDLVRIAEVTDMQFMSDELVDVAVQCLADIARESESTTSSVGVGSAATAAPSHSEKESTEHGTAPPEPEKEPEGTDEISNVQASKDESHNQADDQGARAQDSSNLLPQLPQHHQTKNQAKIGPLVS